MLIGYARVSTGDQDPRLQIDALEAAGCTRIFVDEGVSGAAVNKPELAKALDRARDREDTLVVWKLDRLGRSTRDLIIFVEALRKREIGLRSLREDIIDTTTASGNLVFQVFAVIAQHEREANLERTNAGLAAARRAGVRIGRPPGISDRQWDQAHKLLSAEPPHTIKEVSMLMGVSRQALYRRQRAAAIKRDDD